METTLVSYLTELREGAVRRNPGSAEELTQRVDDIADQCLNLTSEDEIAFASSVLFDEDSGLFSFLEAVLHEKAFGKAREKAISFVAKYLERIKERVAPYALFVRVRLGFNEGFLLEKNVWWVLDFAFCEL